MLLRFHVRKNIFRSLYNLQSLNKTLEGSPQLATTLGMKLTSIGQSTVTMEVKITEMHTRPGGIMSGGTSLVMIETVGSVAGMLTLDPKTHDIFGLEVNANHVRKVNVGETVVAIAEPEHIGRMTQIWNVKLRSSDKLVCTGRITLMVMEKTV